MIARKTLLVVEGPQDAAVVSRLLREKGFALIRKVSELPSALALQDLIPKQFPIRDDIIARHPVPAFLVKLPCDSTVVIVTSENPSPAEDSAAGRNKRKHRPQAGTVDTSVVEKLVNTAKDTLKTHRLPFGGVGMLVDADNHEPNDLHARILCAWDGARVDAKSLPTLPGKPGVVHSEGERRAGVFITPDNRQSGTIEHLLAEAAEAVYAPQWRHACAYVRARPTIGLTEADQRELRKPAGERKASLHALACLLKPGKAIQNSIADNRWLTGAALQLPAISSLARFLEDLVG